MATRGKKLFQVGAIAVLLLFVVVRILVYSSTRHLVATNGWVAHSADVLRDIATLQASLNEAQVSVSDYLSVGDEKTLAPFQQALIKVPAIVQELRALTIDNPTQQARLHVLEPAVGALLQADQALIDQRKRVGAAAVDQPALSSQQDSEILVRRAISALTQEEDQLLAARSREAELWVSRATIIEMVLGVVAAGLLFFAYLFVRLDMNERTRALSAQQESEERIRLLLDSTAEAMYGINLEGLCTFCNPACLEILGYRKIDDLLGRNMHQLTHHTRPDGSPYPLDECKGYQAMRDGKRAHIDDEVLWRSDGTSFPAEYWSYPIWHADKIIGAVITFLDISKRRHSEEKLRLVHDELNAALMASETRAFENTQLSNLGDLFQSCQTVEEACKISANILPTVFGAGPGALCITSASRNVVELSASWNGTSSSELAFAPEDCWALRRGKLHAVTDSQSALRCSHVVGSKGYICVPLAAQGETLGVLYIENRTLAPNEEGGAWEPQGAELERRALAVAERISLALSNLKLRELLRNQSIRDPLTGLFNRRYLEESLVRELHRATRKQRSVALVMLDLDHFKRFNDTFGHPAGDALLREFSAVLKRRVRAGDIACRYGGEEFALIIAETDAVGASACVEQIRQDVKQLNIHYMGQPLGSVTLSAGVAVFPADAATTDDLVRAADSALYRAKSEGRDRIVAFENVPAIL